MPVAHADPKRYAYADFSQRNCLTLDIDGVFFEIAQFNAGFAKNEIPTAQCLLAVGRDTQSDGAAALSAVQTAAPFRQMVPAVVRFHPEGEYRPGGDGARGTPWPDTVQVIFRGYFTGFLFRKVMGRFVVVAPLVHWLVDLACSSSLGRNLHVINPAQLNVSALAQSSRATGATLQANSITYFLAHTQVTADTVSEDLWGVLKSVFCELASKETLAAAFDSGCGGDGNATINDRAIEALKLFEGGLESGCPFTRDPDDPGPEGDREATYAVPLKILESPIAKVKAMVEDAIVREIGQSSIAGYSATTFWDKLVRDYCPQFGLAVVPMVNRALVIADVPAYNGGPWKTIGADEYDDIDFPLSLERPVRAVGVIGTFQSDSGAAVNAPQFVVAPVPGACWTEESFDLEHPTDGMIIFIQAPPWLQKVSQFGSYVLDTSGLGDDKPQRVIGAEEAGLDVKAPTFEEFGAQLNQDYFQGFAHEYYVANALQGRQGSLSGKLRFDIAPGSIVRIEPKPECVGLCPTDTTIFNMYGQVQRVTITLNAEAGMAGTSFLLTHLRSEAENRQTRTSVDESPLFGQSIHGGGKHGAPLVPFYDL